MPMKENRVVDDNNLFLADDSTYVVPNPFLSPYQQFLG